MRADVLAALTKVGTEPSYYETIRLYHATTETGADAIIASKELRPSLPKDPAERQLAQRAGGSVFLASSPAVGDDLHTGQVVLALDVPEDTPAEVLRDAWGDPPRVELELKLQEPLQLPWVDRLDRAVALEDFSEPVQQAVACYTAAPVGQQLQSPGEADGRCRRASQRFISALRHHGSNARLLEWGFDGAWHHAALMDELDAVIDWTSAQFEGHARDPFPLVRTRAHAELEWGPAVVIDMDKPADLYFHDVPELWPWEKARERIPDRGSPEAAQDRH